MSWLSRRRDAREMDLLVRVDHWRERCEAAEKTARAAVYGQGRLAKDLTKCEEERDEERRRVADLIRSLADMKSDLDVERRANQILSDQLLDAVGHNAEPLTPAQRAVLGLPDQTSD